jgi:Holliday junction resolvase RusA-like endonuclease
VTFRQYASARKADDADLANSGHLFWARIHGRDAGGSRTNVGARQMKQELWLPWPPTANNMFNQTRSGRRFISEGYQEWRDLAAAHLLGQRPVKMDCSVALEIFLTAPDKRKWDPDNRIKPIFDVLVSHKIIEDDNSEIIKRYAVEVAFEKIPGATVFVEAMA